MEQKQFEDITLILQQGKEAIQASWESIKAAVVNEYQSGGLTEQLVVVERLLATNFARGLCWLQNVGIQWDMAIMEDCLVDTLNGYYINDQFIENPNVSVSDKVRILGRVLDKNPKGREIFYYFNKMVNNPEICQEDRQQIAKRIVLQGLEDGYNIASVILGKSKEELADIYIKAKEQSNNNGKKDDMAIEQQDGNQPNA